MTTNTDNRDLALIQRDCALAMRGAPADALAMGARLAVMYGLDPILKHFIYLPKANGVYPTVAGLRAYAERQGGLHGIRYRPLTVDERECMYPDLPKGAVVVACTVVRNGAEYTEYGMCSAQDKPDLKDRSAMARTRGLGRSLRMAYPINLTTAEEIEATDYGDPDSYAAPQVQVVQAFKPEAPPSLYDKCTEAWAKRPVRSEGDDIVACFREAAAAVGVPCPKEGLKGHIASMTNYPSAPAFLAAFIAALPKGEEAPESAKAEPTPWENFAAKGGNMGLAFEAIKALGKSAKNEAEIIETFNEAAKSDREALFVALKAAKRAMAEAEATDA